MPDTLPVEEYNPFAPPVARARNYTPFTFRQVLDRYDQDRAQNPMFSKMTLPEYAQHINEATGTTIASAGLEDSWLKRGSILLDQGIEATGLPAATSFVGEGLGAPFGASDMFADVFHGLPRAVVNMAPLLFAPEAGLGYAVGLGSSSVLAGSQAYEGTGSGKAGIITGLSNLLMPGVANRAGQFGLNASGATLRNEGGKLIGETLGQRLAGYGAAQAGALSVMEAGHQGASLVTSGELDFSKKHFLETIVGQLPFLAFDAGTGALSPMSKESIFQVKADRNTKLVNEALATDVPQIQGFTPAFNFNLPQLNRGVPTTPFEPPARYDQPQPHTPTKVTVQIGDLPPSQVTEGPTVFSEPSTRPVVEHNGVLYYQNSETRPGQPNSMALLQRVDNGAPFSAPVSDLRPAKIEEGFTLGKGGAPEYQGPTRVRNLSQTLLGDPIQDTTGYKNPNASVLALPGPRGEATPTPVIEPTGQDTFSAAMAKLTALKTAKGTSVQITPDVQTQVIEPIMQNIFSDKDAAMITKRINQAYKNVLEPTFGVKDAQLGRLSDAELQKVVMRHMEEGASLDDAVHLTLQGLHNSLQEAVNSRINITQQNAEGRTQVEKLSAAMPGLQGLDNAWNKLSMEERANYGKLSPLQKILRWRDDIVDSNPHYNKYDDVHQSVLTAAGDLRWEKGQWLDQNGKPMSDVQAKAYLKNAAKFAYKAQSKSEQGGSEIVQEEGLKSTNVQRQRVDELNKGNKETGFKYEVSELKDAQGKPSGEARIVKQSTKFQSLEAEGVGTKLGEEPGSANVPDLTFSEEAARLSHDPSDDSSASVAEVAKVDSTAADIVHNHTDEILRALNDRLHSLDRTVYEMGVQEPAKLVARAKLMWDYMLDRETGGPNEDVNWGPFIERQSVLHPDWQFTGTDKISPEKQAANWWTNTGKPFLFAVGDKPEELGWFWRQPEVQEWQGDKVKSKDILDKIRAADAVLKQRSKLSAADIPLDKMPIRRDAVGEAGAILPGVRAALTNLPVPPVRSMSAAMTTMDFTQRYFLRTGESPESAQSYSDAVERVLRVSQVFPAASQAHIIGIGEGAGEVGGQRPEVLGAAWHWDTESMHPAWRAVIGLRPQNYSAETQGSMYGMVLGHEAWHVVEGAAARGQLSPGEQRTYEQVQQMSETLDEQQRYDALSEAAKVMGDVSKDRQAQENLEGFLRYSAASPKEFTATAAAFFSKAVADGYVPKRLGGIVDHFIYGDGVIAKFIQMVMRAGSKITSAIKGMFAAQKVGVVEPRPLSSEVKVKIDKINEAFTKLSRTPEEVVEAGRKMVLLDAMKPESIESAIQNGIMPELKDLHIGDKDIDSATEVMYGKILPKGDKRKFNWYERNGMDFMQLAQVHPELKGIAVEALAHEALAKNGAEDALSCLFNRDYHTGKVEVTEMQKSVQMVLNSNKLNDVMSEQARLENVNGKRMTPDEATKFYNSKGVSAFNHHFLSDTRQAMANIGQKLGEQIIRGQKAELVHAAARVMMAGHTTPYRNAINAAERLTAVQLHVAGVEPLPAGVDPITLMSTIPAEFGISAENMAGAGQLLTSLAPKFGKLKTVIAEHPEFVTEQRMGRFGADYTVKGDTKRGFISADSMKELESKIATLSKDAKNTNFQRYDNTDKAFVGLNSNIVDALHEIGNAAFERTLLGQPTDVAQAARQAFQSFGTAVEGELAARGVDRWTQNRRFAAGRETIDMLRNTMHFAGAVPRSLAKTWLRSRASVVLQDAKLVENPEAARISQKHIENILAPDARWSQKAREWTFAYYLGGNLSSAMIEFAQPLLTVPSQLVRNGMGVGEAARTLFNAYGAVTKAYTSGKFENKFVDNVIYQLEQGKLLDKSTLGYFFDGDNVGGLNLAKATDGNTAWETATSMLSRGVGHMVGLSKTLYSKATNITSRVSAVAGALHAEKLVNAGKLKPEEVLDYVREFVTLTAPGTAGRSGRPVGFYGGGPNWISRSLAGSIGSLQGYTMTMTSMFYRMIKDTVSSGKMTGAQGKAALLLLGTQLVAAGVSGLPGVGTAIDVANAAVPDWNIKKNLREGLANLFGDDKHHGGYWSDIALRGLPTVMTGLDVSSRLGLSTMMGVSSYDGFKLQHLLGAPGSILTNLAGAVQQASTGQVGEALEQAAPTSIKNMVRLVRDGGDVRDAQGNLMLEPNTAEKFAMGIGFTPKRAADLREFSALASQADKGVKNESDRFYNSAAEQLTAKNYPAVRQMLLERERLHPGEFSAAEGLKVVVQRAQDRTMPEDPRRGGSKMNMNDRSQLLGTYGIQGPSPTETSRLLQSNQIQNQFGLYTGNDRDSLLKAQMVDRLMIQDLTLTRVQARAKVEEMLRHHSRQQLR